MEYDVLVIGSGVAGSTAGFYLARAGFRVGILSKGSSYSDCNSYYAQGGIVYKGLDDSPEILISDIERAGAGACNPEAVRILAEEGPQAVEKVLLSEFRTKFTKSDTGNLDLTEEGAHSSRRILHSADTTGKSIIDSARNVLENEPYVTLLDNRTAIDIITWDHHSLDPMKMYKQPTSLGVYALNNENGQVEKILSKVVILATGGMGRVYLHSSNPQSATGDGYGMAFRAGARLINMEYTQFHPTTLYHRKARNFLISEAVRGEGGKLIDIRGNSFMEKYHDLLELAPRDIVTRAILSEMLENGDKHVYLDATGIGKSEIEKRFPNILSTCIDYGIDMRVEPIPIVPAFHFSCGGVMTDMFGGTNIKRLFAVGETACTGVHGANRLASTSLLEGVVFGKRVADYITSKRVAIMDYDFPEVPEWTMTGVDSIDPALINQDWASLQNIMWNYVGAIRSKKRLQRAISDLKNLRDEIEDFYQDTYLDKRFLELRNAVHTGLAVAYGAWRNKTSKGAHFRVD